MSESPTPKERKTNVAKPEKKRRKSITEMFKEGFSGLSSKKSEKNLSRTKIQTEKSFHSTDPATLSLDIDLSTPIPMDSIVIKNFQSEPNFDLSSLLISSSTKSDTTLEMVDESTEEVAMPYEDFDLQLTKSTSANLIKREDKIKNISPEKKKELSTKELDPIISPSPKMEGKKKKIVDPKEKKKKISLEEEI
jgi:hypothetical protein